MVKSWKTRIPNTGLNCSNHLKNEGIKTMPRTIKARYKHGVFEPIEKKSRRICIRMV